MTPLRKKMIEAMRMRGFSVRTHQAYLRAVSGLARYYQRCPATLTRQEIEAYFRHLVMERSLAPASCRVHLHGVRFLYVQVLEWPSFEIEVTLPKKAQRIPELLTRAEVARIVGECHNLKHRALLLTCYGCGLRVSELVALQVADIDPERNLLRITQGKGAKDRMVILGVGLLGALRAYWRKYRPQRWLFQGMEPSVPMRVDTAQRVFKRAKVRAEVERIGGIHSLRHAYATHQLEAGLPVHILQRLLGHRSIHSTLRYVHWVPNYRDGGVRHTDLIGALERAP